MTSQGLPLKIVPATGTWLGALFESLATASVRVYASAANAEVGHLRTKSGTREIDLIVEGDDRRVVAIEVKLTQTVSDRDVRHLHWRHDQIGDRLADRIVLKSAPSNRPGQSRPERTGQG